MTLNGQSRLVQWTYLFREKQYIHRTGVYTKYPTHTTLCRFFWRAFFFMPLAWLIILGFSGLVVAGIGIIIFENPRLVGIVTGGITTGTLVGFGVYHLSRTNWSQMTIHTVTESTFIQGLKSVKSKFCPIIHISEAKE